MQVFYTNPRLSALLVIMVLMMGGTALMSLARQEDPTMTERYAAVTTFLPGATALRMESLVSEPIETRLREIPEIRTLKSNSRAGYSLIDVELYDSVNKEQTDVVWSEVRDKLTEAHADLPVGTSAPLLQKRAPIASTVIVALTWAQGGEAQLGILTRLGESLQIRLANLPATRETEIHGEAEEEVLVTVDPYRLAAAGLDARQVAARIRNADTKTSAGRLRHQSADLVVEVDAELDSPERIARIPIREDGQGRVLRVSDVAAVTKAAVDPPRTLAYQGSERAVFVMAKMEPDQQIDTWIARAMATIDGFRSELPPGVKLEVVYNQNDYTGARMRELLANLVSALVIVLATLLWFMGVRSALTVGIALPLSAAMVLGFMNLMSVPLHQMSVTGLIISLGLLIDNAIVVVEEYKLCRRRGLEIPDAISAAIRHLLIPLGASTATTVFAFLTIALAPGGVGDFTGTIGLSVVLAVTSSYFLAMTVVPAITGFVEQRWPHATASDGERRWWHDGFSSAALTRWYRHSLQTVLQRRWRALAVGCVLPLIGFLLAPTLTQQFFPPVDRNQFQIQIQLPAQASVWETSAAVARAQEILERFPDVLASHWTVGEGAPRTYYNVMLMNDGVSSFASGWVDTTSPESTRALLPELQQRLSAALPNAQVLALPFEQGPPFDAPIEVRVVGPDLNTLRLLSDELRLILSTLPDVTYTRAGISASEPKLVFRPNENPAAAAGISTGELPERLNAALSGSLAGTVQEGNTELDVRVRVGDARRDDVSDLSSLPIVSTQGGSVPLDALGSWRLEPTASAIERYQGERISSVRAFLEPFVLPAGVMAQFRAALAEHELQIPDGYRLDIGGEEEERAEQMGNLLSVFVLFAIAMAAVVILSLNSFRQAGIIGIVALLSFGLALFGVRLFGYPFGFQALIGSLGMVGLAINGAIIVLSALKADAGASTGELGATVDVVVDASRHILSTTVTTVGGFIPLILFGGTFWPPLATAIAGGVAGSAILALYTVPGMYLHLVRRQRARAASRLDATASGPETSDCSPPPDQGPQRVGRAPRSPSQVSTLAS
ncbi:MAG: efflux RND transporter permease subunit [Pseudomonadales bacterium]